LALTGIKLTEKNPFENDTPEFQLFENAVSADRQASAFNADVERYTYKAKEARERSERFVIALEKLLKE
jgi:hypothetical protein